MPRGRPNAGPKLALVRKKGWRQALWYIRWSEGGRSHELATETGDRMQAEQVFAEWLLRRRHQPESPRLHNPASIRITEILELYATGRGPQLVDPEHPRYAIKRLTACWREQPVSAVTPATCAQYREERRRIGVKDSTITRELGVLRAALRWAARNGCLAAAPTVEMPPKQPGRDRWLTRSEAARLLWESRKEYRARGHLPLFILIALYTGARQAAILGLRWTQVDLVTGRINFNEPGRPRTNKRRPVIPIPRGLRWFLVKAQARARSPWVTSYRGRPLRNISKGFNTAARRAGLEGVTRHTLRHTCGTWLAQAGVDLYQIAGWLGHSNTRTTELYAHHHPSYLDAARKALER
jgi:integrase